LVEILRGWPWWFGVIVIGIYAGINEELWFRGFLGRGLVGNYGLAVGVLTTSVFFGIMHLDPPHVFATAFMGLVMHYVYLTTRSLTLPILAHALNNSMAVLQVKIQQFSDATDRLDQAPARTMSLLYLAAWVLGGAVAWGLYRSRARLISTGG